MTQKRQGSSGTTGQIKCSRIATPGGGITWVLSLALVPRGIKAMADREMTTTGRDLHEALPQGTCKTCLRRVYDNSQKTCARIAPPGSRRLTLRLLRCRLGKDTEVNVKSKRQQSCRLGMSVRNLDASRTTILALRAQICDLEGVQVLGVLAAQVLQGGLSVQHMALLRPPPTSLLRKPHTINEVGEIPSAVNI